MHNSEQCKTEMPDIQANREHKNSVFSLLFSKPEILRELYSAIEGITLPPDIPVNINTLSNALIKGKINDISFTIDNRLVVLIEHQSTINKNMPLRILKYINRIYDTIFDYKEIFKEELIKIPKPEFIVLYNGEKPYPDKTELHLSDAFLYAKGLTKENKMTLELVVQVYNINHGYNPEIQHKCETLNDYSYFINKIREYLKTGFTLAKSVECAIKYCIESNILKEFLKEHGSEVSNFLFYEYDFDTHLEVRFEEGLEKGKLEKQNYVLELIDQGLSSEEIKQKLEKS